MIAFDFHDPSNAAATQIWNTSSSGGGSSDGVDNVMFGWNDLGGPTFKSGDYLNGGAIVGLHSFWASSPQDINANQDASYGEAGVDTWLNHSSIYSWILQTALNRTAWGNTSGGSVMLASNWFNAQLPSSTMDAEITRGGTYAVAGPGSGQTFTAQNMSLGKSDGVKTLLLNAGGTIQTTGNFGIQTNGVFEVTSGSVALNGLTVSGSILADGPVSQAGRFVFDSTTAGTSIGSMSLEAGGQAKVLRALSVSGQVQNNGGLLSLARSTSPVAGEGNVLSVGSYSQDSAGQLGLGIHAVGPGDLDRLNATGTLTLDGALVLRAGANVTTAAYGDTFTILSGSSVSGQFAQIGYDDNGTWVGGPLLGGASATKALAVTYGASAVVVTVARPGDTDLDLDVDFADAAALQLAYTGSHLPGAAGGSWVEGDSDGDGDVDFSDAMRLRLNYTGSLSASLPASPTVHGDELVLVADVETGELRLVGEAEVLGLSLRSSSGSLEAGVGLDAALSLGLMASAFEASALAFSGGEGMSIAGEHVLGTRWMLPGAGVGSTSRFAALSGGVGFEGDLSFD